MGKNDVAIKIADEGGGASRSDMEHLWTYFYTTANDSLTGKNTLPLVSTLKVLVSTATLYSRHVVLGDVNVLAQRTAPGFSKSTSRVRRITTRHLV